MLGWMLKRGDNAPVVPEGADTTEIDQPDTPAPVFAARALKSAFFGTPARPNPTRPATDDGTAATKTTGDLNRVSDTPPRPQGILLTPGTGTSRRKRVSFGRDVVSKQNGAQPSGTTQATEDSQKKEDESDDEWEEADDDDHCNHDITVDLNEPHSQSGRYWKEEFEKYQKEAKVEMGKLLQYKQRAKSYAHEKDAEAVQLAEMLRDEQQKVIRMEKKIVENASQIASIQASDADDAPPELLSKLTKQTALVVQYRSRIQDLENQLATLLVDKEEAEPDLAGRRRRQLASPRTQKTLIETQRELRRARTQVKELGDLREQVASLKLQLKQAKKQDAPKPTDGDMTARQLREAKEEIKRKDEQLQQLRVEFDMFRQESEAHNEDTRAVLERAHNKISDLKKEVRALKASNLDRPRPNSWHPQVETTSQETNEQENMALMSGGLPILPISKTGKQPEDSMVNQSIEVNLSDVKSQTLREKFQEGAEQPGSVFHENTQPKAISSLAQRPKLEQPRWQPFVPRSPRNRAYLGEVLTERIQNGGATWAATKPKGIVAPDLPALGRALSKSKRSSNTENEEEGVDLMQNGFARLGGPDVDGYGNSTILDNTARSILPPERRAAAIARIEQRMAEKKRTHKRKGLDKENVRPQGQVVSL